MIPLNEVEFLKKMCDTQAEMIPGGVLYLFTDGETFTWRKASAEFDLDMFHVGEKLNPNSVTIKAVKENRTVIENIPRSLYGIRLRTIAEPIVNDEGKVVGAFSTVFPLLHPLVKAFDDFAPILTEMFSDGAVMFVTDLNRFLRIRNSQKFQIPQLKVGDSFNEDTVSASVIKAKKAITLEFDASVYGEPVVEASEPLFDNETGELVGTFNLIIPKVLAANLKEVSKNLEDSLEEIASTIEELAASASVIHENEQNLNHTISEITVLSQEINKTSSFIKEIADETQMLGLNAAIEAARAGEFGRGFGVVAEEIRKLSSQSKSTVPEIKKLTDKIIAKVNESSEKSLSSLSSSQEQAAATEQISASIEEITALSERLAAMALKL